MFGWRRDAEEGVCLGGGGMLRRELVCGWKRDAEEGACLGAGGRSVYATCSK